MNFLMLRKDKPVGIDDDRKATNTGIYLDFFSRYAKAPHDQHRGAQDSVTSQN